LRGSARIEVTFISTRTASIGERFQPDDLLKKEVNVK
jgi:hypothetical protein